MIAYYKGKLICTAIHNKSTFYAFSVNGRINEISLSTLADMASLSLNELGSRTLAEFI